MQNVGFCFALLPIAPADDREARAAFLKRHLGFFNTNPVLASYILGATATAEIAGHEAGVPEDLKRALAGPLGMAGDGLFWGAARPLAGLIGALGAWAFPRQAALALLVVYNVPHLTLRWLGVSRGAAMGPSAARDVLSEGFQRAVGVLRLAAALVAGFFLGWAIGADGGQRGWRGLFAFAFFGLGLAATRLHVPPTVVGLAGAAAGLVLLATGVLGG